MTSSISTALLLVTLTAVLLVSTLPLVASFQALPNFAPLFGGAFRCESGKNQLTDTRLFVLKDPRQADNLGGFEEEDDEEDDVNEDIEAQRQRLKELLGFDSASTSDNDRDAQGSVFLSTAIQNWKQQLEDNPVAPLTAVGRERLQVETRLLQSLATSDQTIRQLWNFWYNARGKHNTATLMAADQLVHYDPQTNLPPASSSNPLTNPPEVEAQLQQALLTNPEKTPREKSMALYRSMIEEEGIYWAEPLNRLATLMYYEARYEEAKDLCEMVLKIKPWHFGCQTGIITICETIGDKEGVEYWSALRMPPLPDEKDEDIPGKITARQEWVNRMVNEAESMLKRGEHSVKESFQTAEEQEAEGESVWE